MMAHQVASIPRWVNQLGQARCGLGVYRGLRRVNLQHYLDEFMLRFNLRHTRYAAFDTLLSVVPCTTPAPLHLLIRKAI